MREHADDPRFVRLYGTGIAPCGRFLVMAFIDGPNLQERIREGLDLGQGLEIDYRVGGLDVLEGPFDLVVSLEVIEHVADPRAFVFGLAQLLADGGLLILSTPNRTSMSRLLMVVLAEGLGRIPKGTHDWQKFLTPDELAALVGEAGLGVTDITGLTFDPSRGFVLSDNKSLDYFITAKRAGS